MIVTLPPVLLALDSLDFKFEQVQVQVPYKHKKEVEMRSYKVHFRPALDAVKHVLEDPALQRYLIHFPERHYIHKPGTNENMRVWSDVHTADDWWTIQVANILLISYVLLMLSAT